MKVVVYPNELGIGGSQLNAVELAAAVRDLGHEVIVFGRSGPLQVRIDELGLEFVEAPPQGRRPSPRTARALEELVHDRGIDVIHGYEWPPILDAALAMSRERPAAVVGTVMSMSVPPFIPRSVPLVVGTEEIGAHERGRGRVRIAVIEPPVDLAHNDVDAADTDGEFRSAHGLDSSKLNVVAVARFARELKLEGTLTAIDTIGRLSRDHPVRLVLVGDGPARGDVEASARRVNDTFGPGTVVLTGQLDDPRPAYACADVALGMGGSALRAMAYRKPLVVQGEQGFWRTLRPETVEGFLWTGWYGVGAGPADGSRTLEEELTPLLRAPARREELGEYGLQLVRDRFSLQRAAGLQLEVYRRAVERPARGAPLSEAAALSRYSSYYVAKRFRRALGREATDDFNARPVTARSRAKEHA